MPSDQNQVPQGKPEAGQPSVPASPKAEQPSGQPQYVTLEQAQAMAKQAEEAAFRRAQGLIDTRANRIDESVRQRLEQLTSTLDLQRAAGIQITPEQQRALEAQVMAEEFKKPKQQQPGSQQQPQQPQDPQQYDPVQMIAQKMLDDAGVEWNEQHPAAANLLQVVNDPTATPKRYLDAVEAYIQANQGQQPPNNNQQQPAPDRTPTNLGGTGGTTNIVQSTNDMNQLWELASKKL